MELAAVATLASGAVQGIGALSGAKAEARRAKLESTIAKTQADQADTAHREDMIRTLSNIKAIRASGGANTSAPTFGAIMDDNRATAVNNREKKVQGYKMQALQSAADASMIKRLGYIKAAGIAVNTLGSL